MGGITRAIVLAGALSAASITVHAEDAPPQAGIELRLGVVNLSPLHPASVRRGLAFTAEPLKAVGIRLAAQLHEPGLPLPEGAMPILLLSGVTRRADRTAVAGATSSGSVWIYPEAVAVAAGVELSRQHVWRPQQVFAFERALSAVLTHELLHRLAGARHSTGGIMAACLHSRDLGQRGTIPKALVPALHEGVRLLAVGRTAPVPPALDDWLAVSASEYGP
jgi:hypothetical protein